MSKFDDAWKVIGDKGYEEATLPDHGRSQITNIFLGSNNLLFKHLQHEAVIILFIQHKTLLRDRLRCRESRIYRESKIYVAFAPPSTHRWRVSYAPIFPRRTSVLIGCQSLSGLE